MMKVGFLGSRPVTFGFEAAQQLGSECKFQGFGTHQEIYEAVRAGTVDRGVVAVENQLAGMVDETLHAVVQPIVDGATQLAGAPTHVRVVQELAVPVALYLMNQSGEVGTIEVVKTHPIPMRQCRETLDRIRKRKRFTREHCASTDAAAAAAQADPAVAAISSKLAPFAYRKLRVIKRVDDAVPGAAYENLTRFWVLERAEPGEEIEVSAAAVGRLGGAPKLALLFNLERDEAGGLARSLEVLSGAGINLASMYALPRRDRSWEYTFVVEFEFGAEREDVVEGALERLRAVADCRLLGLYPRYR